MATSSDRIEDDQVREFQELLGAALRRSDLSIELARRLLQTQSDPLVADLLQTLRRHAEAKADMIVRRARMTRDHISDYRAGNGLYFAGRELRVRDDWLIKHFPRWAGPKEVDVSFFKVGRVISNDDLEGEYERRGLQSAHPQFILAANYVDPPFADTYPNGTHLRDADGRWWYVSCYSSGQPRSTLYSPYVDVSYVSQNWTEKWWFAGIPKTA
jgi:hypothetical protein